MAAPSENEPTRSMNVDTQTLCKFHENKLEYYCQEESCRRFICQTCATSDHENHLMQSLEEAAEDVKQSIKLDMEGANSFQDIHEQALQESGENLDRIRKEIELAKKEVRRTEEMICKMARDHSAAMISALDQALHQQETANHEEQNDINSGISQVSDFKLHCEKILERNSVFVDMESKEVLHKTYEGLSGTASMLHNRPVNQRNMTVRYVVTAQVTQSLQDIGKVMKSVTDPALSTIESLKNFRRGFINKFQIVTRSTESEVCPSRIESIDVKIKDVEGKEVDKEVVEEEIGKYRVSYKAEIQAGEYEIQVNIGGERIKNSPQNVSKLDIKVASEELFNHVTTFGGDGSGELNMPQSIAVSDNGEMAITDRNNHRIQIFSLDGKFLREFGSQGTGEGQLMLPFGVVFNEDRILVSDHPDFKGRMQEFDLNGTYVRTIYRHEQELLGICVNDDKNIAVCCQGSQYLGIKPCIKVFGNQGDLIREFNIADDHSPWYVTYNNGKYFVSYCDKYCVCVFDKNGVFLYKFGEKGEMDGQFNYPDGQAVYGPDMILVCDIDNNRVQLLTQDGEFIRSFGSHGSGVGQMSYPSDVVVTADGRVFVVEWCGNRVSVWY